ncbi:MAG TPA: polysaccharide deacetylase family protein [Tissierellales bacterium]|nr:polysaccharide deacetylase family protein [Tissierellales bacterium]
MKKQHLPITILLAFLLCIINVSCSKSNKTPPSPISHSPTKEEDDEDSFHNIGTKVVPKEEANKIPVLLYHHLLIAEDIEKYNWINNKIVLSVETFDKQMKYLHDNGYYVATLDELRQFIDGEIELPKKTVVITFDDGFLSNIVYGYPIMKQYNLHGTIFVIGSAAESPQQSFDPKTVQYININEMPKYKDVFNFESHTYSLHKHDENKNKKPLIITSDKNVIVEDISKNMELLDAKYIAYPFGSYNNTTIEYLRETNHEMAFTVKQGYVTPGLNKYELPRFEIVPETTMEEFINIVQ